MTVKAHNTHITLKAQNPTASEGTTEKTSAILAPKGIPVLLCLGSFSPSMSLVFQMTKD